MRIEKASLTEAALTELRTQLTVRPYQFGYGAPGADVYFEVFDEEDEHWITVPRFWAWEHYGLSPSFTPAEYRGCQWEFRGELRPNQEEIVKVVEEGIRTKGGGVLSVVCGAGKTACAIYLATRLKLKTLVVVHKSSLLDQWKESVAKFTGLETGLIQQNRVDADKPIVLGMLQSLSLREYPREILGSFDFLIVDEVHNVATKVFSKALLRVTPAFTLGLSATPQRPDGMSKVFHWFLGPMLYRVTAQQAAASTPADVSVRVMRFRDADYRFKEVKNKEGQVLLPIMLSNVAELHRRNDMIVEVLRRFVTESPSRVVLVLSSRVKQLKTLKAGLDEVVANDVKTSLYVGGMKPSELREALEDPRVLFGTYELICEGFDYPRLNTLVFATPRARIEQAVGRILRQRDPENPPIVVDIVDDLPSFVRQGAQRKKFYKSLGYKISEDGRR